MNEDTAIGRQLLASVSEHLAGVTVNVEIGNPSSPDEVINVLIVEGDQKKGIGVVMSEPMTIEPAEPIHCGDIVEWEPEQYQPCGYITYVVMPDFELMGR
jgi:hypothetical protein